MASQITLSDRWLSGDGPLPEVFPDFLRGPEQVGFGLQYGGEIAGCDFEALGSVSQPAFAGAQQVQEESGDGPEPSVLSPDFESFL